MNTGPSPKQLAESLYSKWLSDLRVTKATTDFTFKKMCVCDLEELQTEARQLMETENLDSQSFTKMQLINQRTVEQWLCLLKASRTNNLL